MKISAGINYFYIAALIKGPQHPATDGEAVMAPLRASNVCDDGNFSSPKECALAPAPDRMLTYGGMSKEPYDCFSRVPGVLVLLRNKST